MTFDETLSLVSTKLPPDPISKARPPDQTHFFLKPTSCPNISPSTPHVPAQSLPLDGSSESSTSLETIAIISAPPLGIPPSLSTPLCDSHEPLHNEDLNLHFGLHDSTLHDSFPHHLASTSISNLPCTAPIENLSTRTHSMTTQSMNNIFKPKQFHIVSKHSLLSPLESTCVSQVVSHPEWCATMSSELTTLIRNGT